MTDIIWLIFENAVSLFECCVVIRFICLFLRLDLKDKTGQGVYILGIVLDFALVTAINRFTDYEGVLGLAYILVYFLFALIFLDGTVFQKIYVSLIAVSVLVGVGAAVSSILAAAFKYNVYILYANKSPIRLLSIFIIQILVILIYELILKLSVSSLKRSEWSLILSTLVLSFVSLAFIHYAIIHADIGYPHSIMLMASEFGIIVTNIVCFYMTYSLSCSTRETESLRMHKQQDEYRMQYAETVKAQYEEMRRMRHDMKQNLAVISALQKEGKHTEAFEYANKITDRLSEIEIIVDVGNDFINAILNSKLSTAKNKDIEVICTSYSNISGIEEADLCTLLGNMLDNAIEAAEKCSHGFIEVSIRKEESTIFVRTTNSVVSPVLPDNPALKSTKSDSGLHGYGVKSIKQIAEKYNGTAMFLDGERELSFSCQVTLYQQ